MAGIADIMPLETSDMTLLCLSAKSAGRILGLFEVLKRRATNHAVFSLDLRRGRLQFLDNWLMLTSIRRTGSTTFFLYFLDSIHNHPSSKG
jgi:hypothetical protein